MGVQHNLELLAGMSVLNIAAWSVIAILLIADISVHLWSIKVSRAAHKALELTQSAVASIKANDQGAEHD